MKKLTKKQIFLIIITILLTPAVIYFLYFFTSVLINNYNAISDSQGNFPLATLNFIISSAYCTFFYTLFLIILFISYLYRLFIEFKSPKLQPTDLKKKINRNITAAHILFSTILMLVFSGLLIWRFIAYQNFPGVMPMTYKDILAYIGTFLFYALIYSLFLWLTVSRLKHYSKTIDNPTAAD